MRSFSIGAALLATLLATPLAAQAPAGAPGTAPPARQPGAGAGSAEFFLSHAGELQLTDQQVVRLAAIARRAEARRQAQRRSLDSLRTSLMTGGAPGDSAARLQRREMLNRFRADAARARDQGSVDLRDALAALTPDQQARAWQMAGRLRGVRALAGARIRGMRGARGVWGPRGVRAPRGQGLGRGIGPRAMPGRGNDGPRPRRMRPAVPPPASPRPPASE